MYAVIQSGGKQYRVSVGDRLRVESLKVEPGDTVTLDKVLMTADGDDVTVGNPLLDTAVEAKVVGHGRGEKVHVFKMRRRKNSRNHAGHRQNYTELEITGIGGAAKAAPAKVAEETTAVAADDSE